MNFPRFHVFVDASCPALTSGKISSWVAPSKLVAMVSPQSTQYSPAGSEAAKIIRGCRTRHAIRKPEVQIIIEGELMTGLLLGLGDYILDVYRFGNVAAMHQADLFEQLDGQFDAFSYAVSQATDEFDNIISTIEQIDPGREGLDTSMVDEAAVQVSGGHSAIAEAMDQIAERFASDFLSGSLDEKQAA